MKSNLIERTKFYEEISNCSIDYCPPTQYFIDVLEAITDAAKQINDLRAEVANLRTQLEASYNK